MSSDLCFSCVGFVKGSDGCEGEERVGGWMAGYSEISCLGKNDFVYRVW